MDNPEKMATLCTQDTGQTKQINISENRRGNQEWTIVSCVPNVPFSLDCPFLIALSVFANDYLFCLSLSCVLCTQCCQFLLIEPKEQSRMDNPEKLATLGTQDTGQRQT
jgi:hypothetical protein